MAVAAQAPRTSETARLVTTIDFIDLRLGWSKGSSSPAGIALMLLAMVVLRDNSSRASTGRARRSKTVRRSGGLSRHQAAHVVARVERTI